LFKKVQIGDEFIRLLVATGNGVLYLLCYFITTTHTTDCLLIGYEILVVPLLYCAAALDTQVSLIFCVVHD
jgi:hypothetical protein